MTAAASTPTDRDPLGRLAGEDPTGPIANALLDEVRRQWGRVPNTVAAMAVSPALLQTYLAAEQALAEHGTLPARVREQIALGSATRHGCQYCLAAHTTTARRSARMTLDDIAAACQWRSNDAREQALLDLARSSLDRHGEVSDDELAHARAAGWSDAEIAEAVAHLALNALTNTFNRLAGPVIDW